MKTRYIAFLTLLAGSLYSLGANAAIIEDFRFNEAAALLLGCGRQTAQMPGTTGLSQTHTVESAETAPVVSHSKAIRNRSGSNALEIANVTTGKVWLVVDIAGWLYTATATHLRTSAVCILGQRPCVSREDRQLRPK